MLTRVTEVYLFALLGSGQAGKIVKQSAWCAACTGFRAGLHSAFFGAFACTYGVDCSKYLFHRLQGIAHCQVAR